MPKVYVGVTDRDWYIHLALLKNKFESTGDQLDEVNFWQPGGSRVFRTLNPGDLFLFKLHSPDNFIVGGGVFASANLLPSKLAWEAFGEKNGAASLQEMQRRIVKYRSSGDLRGTIGCILLQRPFFLERRSWVPALQLDKFYGPGKTYQAAEPRIQDILLALKPGTSTASGARELDGPMFGEPVPIRQRLGQGTFRVMILDAFERRCAVTGERTLPVLESAHIKPVGEGGRHATDNGLLLRSDVHRLFDSGYVTVTPTGHFRVSGRIKQEYDNGEEYYALDGSKIRLPRDSAFHPRKEFLEWHADSIFSG